MNHRDLVLSAPKKIRSHFLRLPKDLQDTIIAGLENNQITFTEASRMAENGGYKLSFVAISNYYRAVRRERRAALLDKETKQAK